MEAENIIKEEIINNKQYRITEEVHNVENETHYYISVKILRKCLFWSWWKCLKLYYATSKRARRAQINNAVSYLIRLDN